MLQFSICPFPSLVSQIFLALSRLSTFLSQIFLTLSSLPLLSISQPTPVSYILPRNSLTFTHFLNLLGEVPNFLLLHILLPPAARKCLFIFILNALSPPPLSYLDIIYLESLYLIFLLRSHPRLLQRSLFRANTLLLQFSYYLFLI